jgi:hypothetical protein
MVEGEKTRRARRACILNNPQRPVTFFGLLKFVTGARFCVTPGGAFHRFSRIPAMKSAVACGLP